MESWNSTEQVLYNLAGLQKSIFGEVGKYCWYYILAGSNIPVVSNTTMVYPMLRREAKPFTKPGENHDGDYEIKAP